MIIAHNMAAVNTQNKLNITGNNKNKALERLSSGYKINRAADNSAGLAISEEMRGQIRGLNRGAMNCCEGNNMIDTAEGAITEQINVLQRMRELTVQANNDTNTQDDRLAIQKEVNALSAEINRIAEQTEYNTIKVLQGKKTVVTTETIQPSSQYTEVKYYQTISNKLPDWLTRDDKMVRNNDPSTPHEPGIVVNITQDTSATVTFNFNGMGNPVTYGPNEDSAHQWSSSINDNYSAGVNFKNLAELNPLDASDNSDLRDRLLGRLTELAGTGIGYNCASCTKVQAIGFSTDEIKMMGMYAPEIDQIQPSEYRARYEPECRIVDLQKYIDKVAGKVDENGNVIERGFPSEAEFNTLSQAEQNAIFGTNQYSDIAQQIKDLAKDITNSIIDEIVQRGYTDHFIRIAKDDTNPYQIDFYDIRDDGALQESANAINPGQPYAFPSQSLSFINAYSRVESKVLIENQPVTLTRADEYDYYIQMGANSSQGVEIEFPDTSLKGIDLEDYSVFRDGYCSITDDKKYNASMLNGAEDLGNHIYRNGHIGGQEQTITGSYQYTKYNYIRELVEVRPAGTNQFGEYIPPKYDSVLKQGNPPSETVTEHFSYTTMVGGYDATFEAYKPDDMWRIDRAIANLSDKRSYLGAMHNRLEHAYANDTNTSENLQAAESKLRDADMADEMVAFSAANILEQAGTSMLAQANQSKQGILSLLG